MTPRELMQRIQEQVFKGEMKRPVVLRSSADCAAFARSSPGAVCVASAQLASPETRVIPIRHARRSTTASGLGGHSVDCRRWASARRRFLLVAKRVDDLVKATEFEVC